MERSGDQVVVGILSRVSARSPADGWSYRSQEDAARQFALQRRWLVLEPPFRDVNVSAYRPGVFRPAYEQLLADLSAGRIQGIIVWKIDRLIRNDRELVRLDRLLDETGGFVASVKDPVDTRLPGGRAALRAYVWAAHREAASIAERQEAKHAELARRGQDKGGGLRPFGYDASRRQLDVEEAELIREAARRVLDQDWTFAAVAADWYERGVLGTTGRRVRAYQVRRILEAPRVAGIREYKGSIIGPAAWPAILDPVTWQRIRALPRQERRPRRRREYLLDGDLLRCGACGHRMRGTWYRPRSETEYGAYRCPGGTQRSFHETDACGKVFVRTDRVDELVVQRALERLALPGVLATLCRQCDPDDVTAEAARGTVVRQTALRRQVEEAGRNRKLTHQQRTSRLRRIDSRAAAAEKALELRRLQVTGGVDLWGLPKDDLEALRKAFGVLPMPAQTSLLKLAVESVVVLPSSKRAGSRFNPDRLRVREREIDVTAG
jgi:DNA invertase Pin-like site-specific DNA recombinase